MSWYLYFISIPSVELNCAMLFGGGHSFLSGCWMTEDPCIWKDLPKVLTVISTSLLSVLSCMKHTPRLRVMRLHLGILLPLFQMAGYKEGFLELLQRPREILGLCIKISLYM